MAQTFAVYPQILWKYKCLSLSIFFTIYLSLFVTLNRWKAARLLPPGIPLSRDIIKKYPQKRTYSNSMLKIFRLGGDTFSHRMYINFSRSELDNLQFSKGPVIGSLWDGERDVDHEFPCTQPNVGALEPNETEDLMCLPRPRYLSSYKNPCFEDENKNFRCLPYFHILGADKCGTTDFHFRLTRHPHILGNQGGLNKEIYYWCWLRYGLWMHKTREKKRFSQYLYFFNFAAKDIKNAKLKDGSQLITGDGTPMDLWDFRGWYLDPQNKGLTEPRFFTPHAMRHIYKNPKFIVLLRNPVDRLYSDYLFLGYGFTPMDFAEDVPTAIEILLDCLKFNSTRQCFFSDEIYHKMPMRLHIGCYSMFLREWFSVFPKKDFLIHRTEDFQRDISGTLQKTFQFLSIQKLTPEKIIRLADQPMKHQTSLKTKVGDMFPQTRKLLIKFYSKCNENLAELLDDQTFLWNSVDV